MHSSAQLRVKAQKMRLNLPNLLSYVSVHGEDEKSPTHISETHALRVKFSKIKLGYGLK